MGSKIRVLKDDTINKIAAGEVVENPASVVKELVENSLDAGATDICVEIMGGGRQLIRISDNGCGMNGDDALLCLERYATSKLKDINDMQSLMTMGFRGEAIPSIASISKFMLLTCDKDSLETTLIIVDGGKIVKCCPAERSPGTTIEVKSLFFNVPVRKKFLRSPAYDTNEILKVLSIISLGNPSIKFQLISNHQSLLNTGSASLQKNDFLENLKHRMECVLGSDFVSGTSNLEHEQDHFKLSGFIGKSFYTRHNRTGQYLFINSRPVFSPLVYYAIKEGYGTMLATNRYPVFVLHLSMPGPLVDVNVHPQKREVRLRQDSSLKNFLIQAIEKGLQKCPLPFFESVSVSTPAFLKEDTSSASQLFEKPFFPVIDFKKKLEPVQSSVAETKSDVAIELKTEKTVNVEVEADVSTSLKFEFEKPKLRVIGTIKNFILVFKEVNGEQHLFVVNQQAAHQRILFEKLKNTMTQPIELQSLLFPITVDLPFSEANRLKDHLELFETIGISIKEFGKNSFIINALSFQFKNGDIKAVITEILKELDDHQDTKNHHIEKKLCLAISRISVGSNKTLPLNEAQALVNQLMSCESAHICPQGNPTLVELNAASLSKLFNAPNKLSIT